MSGAKVKINISGVRDYLRSPSVQAFVGDEADKVAQRANGLAQFHAPFDEPAYYSSARMGEYTAIGTVSANRLGREGTGQNPVVAENRAHNTLLKAMGGGAR